MVADALGNDVAGAGQRFLGAVDLELVYGFRVDELGGFRGGIGRGVRLVLLDEVRQRLQSLLLGNGGARATLRPERREQVFQHGDGQRLFDLRLQRVREQLALLQRFEDGLTSVIELRQLHHAVANAGDCHFIEHARRFLAVSGDEGHGAALGNEFRRRSDLRGFDVQFAGKCFNVFQIHDEEWGMRNGSADRLPGARCAASETRMRCDFRLRTCRLTQSALCFGSSPCCCSFSRSVSREIPSHRAAFALFPSESSMAAPRSSCSILRCISAYAPGISPSIARRNTRLASSEKVCSSCRDRGAADSARDPARHPR